MPAQKRFLFSFLIASAIFLFSLKSVLAKIEVTDCPSRIEIDKEFKVNVSLSNLSSPIHFLSIALHKRPGDPYFGQTKNGDSWIEADDANCKSFPQAEPVDGSWSSELTGRVIYNEKDFDNSLGDYILKVFKYTSFCSKSSSDEFPVELFGSSPPTPIPTPPPASISYPAGIILFEFMPNPDNGNEWVEIKNTSSSEAVLTDWEIDDIADGGGSPKKFSATIPGGRLL